MIHPRRHRPVIGAASDEELLTEFNETPEETVYALIEYLRRQENADRHVQNELEWAYHQMMEDAFRRGFR